MTVTQHWSTPVSQDTHILPEKMRRDLINVLIKREDARTKVQETSPGFHEFMKSKQAYAVTPYNIFNDLDMFPEERDSIIAFEKFACKQFREYLKEGVGVAQADDLKLTGRCFGNVQEPGARTYPHYHQGMDGVLIHYLEMGDGGDTEAGRSVRHGSHALLLQDPRPVPSYPYWEKVLSVAPYQGLTLIHPAYLWHESNPWRGNGKRVVIVVNFKVASHNYVELESAMRF